MKTKLILFTLFTLVSCGKTVKQVKGTDYNNRISDVENRVKSLEDRVSDLEARAASGIDKIGVLSAEIKSLKQDAQLNTGLINSLQSILDAVQEQVNSNIVSIIELQEQDSVMEIVDFCGDGLGYDEVGFKTKSGKLIAYFESGNNRFLTVLTSGNYRTTDGQACNFTVE